MRSDDVVPLPVEAVGFQVDRLHLLVGDPPPRGVFSAAQTTDDLQALCGRCPRDQVGDRLVVAQRFAPPSRGDEREEAMLDLVPLAGARQEMTHRHRPSHFVGQLLQLPFPPPQARSVAPARIRGDEDRPRRAVQAPAFRTLPAADGAEHRLGRFRDEDLASNDSAFLAHLRRLPWLVLSAGSRRSERWEYRATPTPRSGGGCRPPGGAAPAIGLMW